MVAIAIVSDVIIGVTISLFIVSNDTRGFLNLSTLLKRFLISFELKTRPANISSPLTLAV